MFSELQSEREKITAVLNSGLDDIMGKINNNNNINNILENIISETNDLESADKFDLILGITIALINEVSLLKNKESELKREAESLREVERENKQSISNVEEDVENLLKSVNEYKMSELNNFIISILIFNLKQFVYFGNSTFCLRTTHEMQEKIIIILKC